MEWTVKTPTGTMLHMLPPGISCGAEMEPDCYRIARASHKKKREAIYGSNIITPNMVRAGAPLGLKKGVFNGLLAAGSGKKGCAHDRQT